MGVKLFLCLTRKRVRLFCDKGGIFFQSVEQFLMVATEAAVAEHGDDVSGPRVFNHFGNDGFHVWQVVADAAEAGDVGGEFGRIEPIVFQDFMKIRNGGDDGEVCECESLGKFVLENGTAGGVGARLEQNP